MTNKQKNVSRKFWIVYNPNKRLVISHGTEKEADTEARKFAARFSGERFIVLESMFECVTAPAQIVTEKHQHAPQPAPSKPANNARRRRASD